MPLPSHLKAILVAAWMVILLSKPAAQTSPATPSPIRQSVDESDHLFERRDKYDMNRNTLMIMSGVTQNSLWWNDYYARLESPSWFLYGVQYHPKSQPFMVAVFFKPLLYHDQYNSKPRKNGLNAEFSLSLKKLQVGRFSGILNPGYWGIDLRWGKRSYFYEEEIFSAPPQTVYVWSKTMAVMIRIGLQRSFGPFYMDLAFSTGFQNQYRENTSQGFIQRHPDMSLIFEPTVNLGFRI